MGRSVALNVIDKRGDETGLDRERFERKMEKGLAERSEAGEKEKTQSWTRYTYTSSRRELRGMIC